MWILSAKIKALAKGCKNMLEPAKYLERVRKRKEAKIRKVEGQMCTYTAHTAQVKTKNMLYAISPVLFYAKRKYGKWYSMAQIPFPGAVLIPKISGI